ncbi:hypothetical protein FRB95_003830 [Tulasnella sp. JGI-2019a]|nr:hypothetical protein FRB95_003830 [Tulasnella sp. JGI-2019a]
MDHSTHPKIEQAVQLVLEAAHETSLSRNTRVTTSQTLQGLSACFEAFTAKMQMIMVEQCQM